jgi:transposase
MEKGKEKEKVDTRTLPREVLEEKRRMAIRLREELNLTWKEIARLVQVHLTTVLGWSKRYQQAGEAGLKDRRQGRAKGEGRRLSPEQESRIQEVLLHDRPSQHGIERALWTREAVRALIARLCGVTLPIRTVGLYLQRWGLRPQRPMKRAIEQDAAALQRWQQEVYPQIAERARKEDAVIYWADETAVQQDAHWVRGYAPPGRTPVLAQASQRTKLTLISALTNRGRVHFALQEEAIDTERFRDFLERLVADTAPRKAFVIVDNLAVHHARAVRQWVEANLERIELFYLPPYTPELNPDELLNRDLKTELRRLDRTGDKQTLREKAHAFLQYLQNTPGRVKGYFKHKTLEYIAQSDALLPG